MKVYPRVCGGNPAPRVAPYAPGGLSPRVRGKLAHSGDWLRTARSIPACAGETPRHRPPTGPLWVYPRVCGGNRRMAAFPGGPPGLSPRVRGKLTSRPNEPKGTGSIPACAGETNSVMPETGGTGVYPRVCGGNSPGGVAPYAPGGLSPRVRGKLDCRGSPSTAGGSIPACAGETAGMAAPLRV